MAVAPEHELTEETISKAEIMRDKLLELAGEDSVVRQQIIEMLILGHCFLAANADEIKSCYIIDSMCKHAKQYLVGKNLISEGKRRIR